MVVNKMAWICGCSPSCSFARTQAGQDLPNSRNDIRIGDDVKVTSMTIASGVLRWATTAPTSHAEAAAILSAHPGLRLCYDGVELNVP